MLEQAANIARRFCLPHVDLTISPLGDGLINDTFLVNHDDLPFVLQKINHHVFPEPKKIIDNLIRIHTHLTTQKQERQLIIPEVLKSQLDEAYFQDEHGHVWRALQYISQSESRNTICRESEAEQIGFALGHFHRLLHNLDIHQLHITLPGFHHTPQYLQRYRLIADRKPSKTSIEAKFCQNQIEQYASKADILEKAKQTGELTLRIVHGDPKLNNFLFASGSDDVISLIDLDTVMPGLIQYDIADCIRSCCHIKHNNRLDIDKCSVLFTHYLQEAGAFLTDSDYQYLCDAVELIPFELGLRFYSDYLNGNLYFKSNHPEQNLFRAVAQFELSQHCVKQRSTLTGLIKRIRRSL